METEDIHARTRESKFPRRHDKQDLQEIKNSQHMAGDYIDRATLRAKATKDTPPT
jgi:hypothetical protein